MDSPIRSAPCVPHWLTLEREAEMWIEDRIRCCTAFIGQPLADRFDAVGTGFFAYFTDADYDFTYFFTAAHIIWPSRRIRKQCPTEPIYIRVNTKSGPPLEHKTLPTEWIFHRDRYIDICAYELAPQIDRKHQLDNAALQLNSISYIDDDSRPSYERMFGCPAPKQYGMGIGDELFVIGAFVSRVGEKKNIPIIRVGNVAAMPEEPVEYFSPRQKAYLIETRSLGGLSGSPVFFNLEERRPKTSRIVNQSLAINTNDGIKEQVNIVPYLLIGMILGAHSSGEYMRDFNAAHEAGAGRDLDYEFNSGISVVLPAIRIIEFLQSPEMNDARKASIEARRKNFGYRIC